MKLEAGKSYYRRDGGVESIVKADGMLAQNATGTCWWKNGSANSQRTDDSDLLSEVPSAGQAFSETAEAGLSVVRYGNGHGCNCGAHGESECACMDADWTDPRIYQLEKQLAEITEQRDRLVDALLMIATFRIEDGQCDNGFGPAYFAREALKGASHE